MGIFDLLLAVKSWLVTGETHLAGVHKEGTDYTLAVLLKNG